MYDELAGQAMAHAFSDELEKISTRIPKRMMRGPLPKERYARRYVEISRRMHEGGREAAAARARTRAGVPEEFDYEHDFPHRFPLEKSDLDSIRRQVRDDRLGTPWSRKKRDMIDKLPDKEFGEWQKKRRRLMHLRDKHRRG